MFFYRNVILGNRRGRSALPRGMRDWVRRKKKLRSGCIVVWVALASVSCDIVSLFKATTADFTGELVGALSIVLPHMPIQRGFLSTGKATHLTPEKDRRGELYPEMKTVVAKP